MRQLSRLCQALWLSGAWLLNASFADAADSVATASPNAAAMSPDNPFAQPSSLPYELPPFERIRDSDYRPAFVDAMAAQRFEIDAMAHEPEAPTFANSNGDDEMRKIETEMAPQLFCGPGFSRAAAPRIRRRCFRISTAGHPISGRCFSIAV